MRFWLRWYGTPIERSPFTEPSFGYWCVQRDDGRYIHYALVEAPLMSAAWRRVREYWPDAIEDFAEVKSPDWRPDPRWYPEAKP